MHAVREPAQSAMLEKVVCALVCPNLGLPKFLKIVPLCCQYALVLPLTLASTHTILAL